ncbi:MAG: CBS domain-containing protein [Gammaproteobacteria bacterium]|nr:CBS domain-containing protein [Gammaproteobacteria bacterium]
MNRESDNPPSSHGDAGASPKSLLDRLSQALLGEPSNREELVEVLRDSASRNLMSHDALEMIEGVLQVADMQVRDIMVPRAQMDVVDKNQTPEEYLPLVVDTAHSRFPMIDGDKDRVVGILLAKDVLRYFYLQSQGNTGKFDIDDYLRPAIFVPESKRLNVLLREFRSSRNHMAIVVDEYGGVAGLVTIEDVLEQIVGEIEDEHDEEEDEIGIVKRNDGAYVVKALTAVEDFNEHFQAGFNDEMDTIGGIVMTAFGHVPRRGERISINQFEFEVLRADSRRIHLLKVEPIVESS